MKILAIETSCEHASVALCVGEEWAERRLDGHANHSERLLPTIRDLLAHAGVGLPALDAVAFGAGPGAFTGLRLACAAAQGLAMGAGIGVVPVPSLAALASGTAQPRVLALTDARMGEVYAAAYRFECGEPVQILPPACVPPGQVSFPESGSWFVAGSALRAHPDLLARFDTSRLTGFDPAAVPCALEVGRLARHDVAAGRILAPECATPLYVRDKVALTTAERLARGGRA